MFLKFENGFLFKDFVEFVATSSNNLSCWLDFTKSGLRVMHESECDDEKCPAVWYVDAVLYASGFTEYVLDRALRINVDPKKIVKLCRNVKKKDVVELSFNTDPTVFSMIFRNECKVERKVVPHISHFEEHDRGYKRSQRLIPEDMFVSDGFAALSTEISNLKKAVGNKKESIGVEFIRADGHTALVFSAYSQFLSPLRIALKERPTDSPKDVTRVVISGTVLNVISKMTGLAKEINLYSISKKYENPEADNGWIRATCEVPHGLVSMYVMAKLN